MVSRIPLLLYLSCALSVTPRASCEVHVSSATETFEIDERPLPLSFSVPSGSRLYVGGSRITDALFERTSSDSLSLNGQVLRLTPWTPIVRHSRMSDGRLLAIYGGIPYFEEQMSAGASVVAASRRLERARQRLYRVAFDTYAREKESGSDEPQASHAALEALRSADTDSLIDWTASALALLGDIELYWREPTPRFATVFSLRTEAAAPDFRRSERLDRQYVTTIHYYTCECPDTCWVFLGSGGSGTAYCGRVARQAVRAQLEHALETGDYGDYPLSPEGVKAVVENATLPN